MDMDSGLFTEKYCRSAVNIVCCILITALTVAELVWIFTAPQDMQMIAATVATGYIALSAWILALRPKAGCALMRVQAALFTLICLCASAAAASAGLVMLGGDGAEESMNQALAAYGYELAVPAFVIGAVFIAAAVVLLLCCFSFMTEARFLNSIKKSLSPQKKANGGDRVEYGGARFFGASAVIMCLLCCLLEVYAFATVLAFNIELAMSAVQEVLVVIAAVLLPLIFLFAGVSAGIFANTAKAYNANAESKEMTVQSGADGVMYVPIVSEDTESGKDDAGEGKDAGESGGEGSSKPYICQETIDALNKEISESKTSTEQSII